MKYTITVNQKTYEVEIENINARPVIAHVDGERFEVMPEDAGQAETRHEAIVKTEKKTLTPNPSKATATSSNPEVNGKTLTAPLPGTVVEVFVKAGDNVEAGHVMLVIEAMKMKNSIRSVYGGSVSEVLVNVGQSVAHKQTLIKYAGAGEA
jgi:glutaconyl-CoA/methylmalonyl-CoA decarboxylase subunit gamma